MMRKLFVLVYIVIGVIILYQTSRLIGTIVEKSLQEYNLDTTLKQEEIKPWTDTMSAGLDISFIYSPLFYSSQNPVEEGTSKQEPSTDSPLLRMYELNGVIILPDNRSIAMIRKAGEKTATLYKKGDTLEGARLIKIERDKVYLDDGTSTVVMPMYYRYTISKSTPPAGRAEQPGERTPGAGRNESFPPAREIRKVLSRSEVETEVFQKVNQILSKIAISPYMVDGKMEGLRLMRVPRDNIVYQLGGRSGDIIRRVNGHELNQVDQMYKLWENIKDDSFITVDLERNNQIYTYSFEIRE